MKTRNNTRIRKVYKICETFVSWQGEGIATGVKAFFIRMSGCNLKCVFCDEPKHKNDKLTQFVSAERLASLVKKAVDEQGVQLVVITGGEPTLQDLDPLIEQIQRRVSRGIVVSVETNGYNLNNCQAADIITFSPKSAWNDDELYKDFSYVDNSKFDCTAVEVKIPFAKFKTPEGVLRYYLEHIPRIFDRERLYFWLTPINGMKSINEINTKACVEFLKKYEPEFGRVRINTQAHKLWGVE